MSRKTADNASTLPKLKAEGLRFAFAGRLPFDFLEHAPQLIAVEGGRLEEQVSPELDYLVLGDPPDEALLEQAEQANQAGAAIRLIPPVEFYHLFEITREEAMGLLQGGPAGLERWRVLQDDLAPACPLPSLAGVDLSGLELDEVNLVGACLDESNLSEAKLNEARLDELSRATLNRAQLKDAEIGGLVECSACEADLTHAWNDDPIRLDKCDFSGAILRHARFAGQAIESRFHGADLRDILFSESKLCGCDFIRADLRNGHFKRSDFTGAIFQQADLRGADFSKGCLKQADLSGADLRKANLAEVDLSGAIIDGANFSEANLIGAELGSLDVSRAEGLDPKRTVFHGKAGPHMHRLAEIAKKAKRIETSVEVELDGGRVCLQVGIYAGQASAYCTVYDSEADPAGEGIGHPADGSTVQECFLNHGRRWGHGKLRLDSVTLDVAKGGFSREELTELVRNTWSEAFGG